MDDSNPIGSVSKPPKASGNRFPRYSPQFLLAILILSLLATYYLTFTTIIDYLNHPTPTPEPMITPATTLPTDASEPVEQVENEVQEPVGGGPSGFGSRISSTTLKPQINNLLGDSLPGFSVTVALGFILLVIVADAIRVYYTEKRK
ncbi:MAG: hypothetical protein V1744_05740 [Candidatus Altiarchaeota archaeon]